MDRHVFLIGLRGSGKSTVGSLLSDLLNRPCFDTDLFVIEQANCSIAEIFSSEGESGFRDRESEALLSLSQRPPAVIATGGGVILRETNREVMTRAGFIVLLTAPISVLADRITRDPSSKAARPTLVQDALSVQQEIQELSDARSDLYHSLADFVCSTEDRSPNEVASSIVEKLQAGSLGSKRP